VRLDAANLRDLARGCAMLGAGGGGDPDLGLAMALHAVEQHGPVEVLPLADLPAGACVMPCGLVGSPVIAEERIWSGDEGEWLRAVVAPLQPGPIVALMCFEIAGANGLLPVTWAARMGLSLADADGKGRAFPRIEQQAMHLAGVAASPVVLTDSRSSVVIAGADDACAGRLALGVAAGLGGVCATALCCMTVERAREAAIGGSVSRAVAVGRARAAGGRDAVREALGAISLIEGTVVDVERVTGGEMLQGSATVQADGDVSRTLRLEFQSEYLLALEDGAVCASVPDVICVSSSDTGDPVAVEYARFGDRVEVMAWPGPEVWRSGAGLALSGPGAFGYEMDYRPLARA
jgi:DUF917 family protein